MLSELTQELCEMSELRSCVRVEVAVLGSPSLISLRVSVDVKSNVETECYQSSGAVSESRWTSWDPRSPLNSPCGLCGCQSNTDRNLHVIFNYYYYYSLGEGRRHSQGQKSQEHQGGRHGQQSGEQDPQNGGRGQQSGGQDSQNGGRGQQSGEQDPQEGGRGHQSGGRGHGRRGRGKRQAQITHFLETALIVDFSEYSV